MIRLPLVLSCCLFAGAVVATKAATVVITPGHHHLGDSLVTGWPETTEKPEGVRFDRTFAWTGAGEATMRLRQRDVHDTWRIEINGRRLGRLEINGGIKTAHYAIPAGVLTAGENRLAIVPKDPRDDIAVGDIQLLDQPIGEVLQLGRVKVVVREVGGGALPVRITIANATNRLADIHHVEPPHAAWREGIIYSGSGQASFDLPAGRWIVAATRGMEWSMARREIEVKRGGMLDVALEIEREVDTKGFIACDTHLHTYELSGHGDASVDERVVTLAGEGVEMAVATDHNHHTDYRPAQGRLGLSKYYTPVIGNEVTTANGHFNAFPFTVGGARPNQKETNWVRLVEDIRLKGAKFVILNHPRWPSLGKSPMGVFGLNRGSGERAVGPEFTFDAMEVVNSTSLLKDPGYLLHDWFALLNRGERIWGVGSSDTHTVADATGQGRTYVRSASDDPSAIDIDAACASLRAGDMSLSMGIFLESKVNDEPRSGRIVAAKDGKLTVETRVAAPGWITPRTVTVFINGTAAASQTVPMTPGRKTDATLRFTLPAPAHDAHLVCVVLGDGVKEAAWATYENYTFAASNPVFVDVDADGKYSSPRATALRLLAGGTLDLARVEKTLGAVDAGLGVQILAEARGRLKAGELEGWRKLLVQKAAQDGQFQRYLRHLPENGS